MLTKVGEAKCILVRSARRGMWLGASPLYSPAAAGIAKAAVDISQTNDGYLAPNSPFSGEVAVWLASLKSSCAMAAVLARGLLVSTPFFTGIGISSGGFSAADPGEGKAILMSKLIIGRDRTSPITVSALTAFTDETLDAIGAAGNQLISDESDAELGAQLDAYFYSQLVDSSADRGMASGTDALSAARDIRAMLKDVFVGQNPRKAFWLMGTTTIVDAVALTDSDGLPVWPDLELGGGQLLGAPAFVSSGIPSDALVLCDGSQIAGQLDSLGMTTSRNTSLEFQGSPMEDATTGAGAQLVSLFQAGSTALKVSTRAFAARLRPSAASILSGVNWNG